jgi:phosphatidylglycerophosphate synthase
VGHNARPMTEAVQPGAVRQAVVVAARPEALAVIGGLPLAVRAVLELRAGGFTTVDVVAGPGQREVDVWLERRGLGRGTSSPSALGPSPVLVVMGDVLFDMKVLAPLLAKGGAGQIRVVRTSDMPRREVWAAVCPAQALTTLVAGLDSGRRSLGDAIQTLGAPDEPEVPLGEGLFIPLDGTHVPTKMTVALLSHLGRRAAATDGYLATLFDRHVSRWLTRRILDWPVTPNQVTIASIIVGLIGAIGLATPSYSFRLGGVLALLLSSVLDGVDGELARARFEKTATGARLDLGGDYAINLATFAALAVSVAHDGLSRVAIGAAMLLLLGVGVAMGVMHAFVNGPVLARSDDLHDASDAAGPRGAAITTVVEKLAGRDYLYLLLVLAGIGRLDWFVYVAAIGSWIFVAALLVYWSHWRTTHSAATRWPVA